MSKTVSKYSSWILLLILGAVVVYGINNDTPVPPDPVPPSPPYWGLVVSNTAWGYDYWGSFFGKTQIDIIKQNKANGINIMLDKYAWELDSTSNVLGIPYKDYIKQLVQWCKPELNVILCLTRDSRTGGYWGYADSPTEGKGAVILNYNGQRDEWIAWGKEVVAYCKPKGIGIMNEPHGGGGEITFDYYYDNFLMPSINAYRSVDPEISVLVMPYPFYSLELFNNRPIDDPNVYYEWHLYYPQGYPYSGSHLYLNNAINAYYESNLYEGKQWLYKYLDDFKFGNLPRDRIYWGEAGCYGMTTWEPTQPNWEVWLDDCYEYTRNRGMVGITQYAAGVGHYCIFDPNTDYTTLTPYGQAWADAMREGS